MTIRVHANRAKERGVVIHVVLTHEGKPMQAELVVSAHTARAIAEDFVKAAQLSDDAIMGADPL